MPAQPCLACHRPTTNGTRCPTCSTRYETARVAQRGTRAQRGYGYRWVKARNAAVKASPICEDCGATEDLTGEHIIPRKEGGGVQEIIPVLCRRCNSRRGGKMKATRAQR